MQYQIFLLSLLPLTASQNNYIPSVNRTLTREENIINQATCGDFIQRKVLHGDLVKKGEAPWMVALNYFYDNVQVQCTGTLISKRHVVTAAHCLHLSKAVCENREVTYERTNPFKWKVSMANTCSVNYSCVAANQSTEMRIVKVNKMFVPAGYLASFCNQKELHDIAIFELEEDLVSSPYVYPACLTDKRDEKPNDIVKGYGFGRDPSVSVPGSSTSILKGLSWNITQCESGKPTEQICTHGVGEQLGCIGDSGHGLYRERMDQKIEIMGVYSNGFDCDSLYSYQLRGMDANPTPEVFNSIVDNLPFICQSSGICVNETHRVYPQMPFHTFVKSEKLWNGTDVQWN